MKVIFSMLAAVFALTLTVGSASAGCPSETPCFDDSQSLVVDLGAMFTGFGSSLAIGDEVANLVEKQGGAMTEVSIDFAGSGCGLNCQDITVDGWANAFEQVDVLTAAIGSTPGEEVVAINQGGALAGITLDFSKFNITPAD
tara:strand:- start:1119 stop:1544 length:426 start_codon:yes stop_codon:yes gene_type:complete